MKNKKEIKVKKKIYVYNPNWKPYYASTLVGIFSSSKKEVEKWILEHCEELGLDEVYDCGSLGYHEVIEEIEDNNE